MTDSFSRSILSMVSQSRDVLISHDVATFKQYENAGGQREALVYVALAALVGGLFNLGSDPAYGAWELLLGFVVTVSGFLVLTYAVCVFGNGAPSSVLYTFALFFAPLGVMIAGVVGIVRLIIPDPTLGGLLTLVGVILQLRFAYLAVRASLNLASRRKAVFILTAALFCQLVCTAFITLIHFGYQRI